MHEHHSNGSLPWRFCHFSRLPTLPAASSQVATSQPTALPASHRAAMTGQYKIPNACHSCHADKTTAWGTEALRRWPKPSRVAYGLIKSAAPTRSRVSKRLWTTGPNVGIDKQVPSSAPDTIKRIWNESGDEKLPALRCCECRD